MQRWAPLLRARHAMHANWHPSFLKKWSSPPMQLDPSFSLLWVSALNTDGHLSCCATHKLMKVRQSVCVKYIVFITDNYIDKDERRSLCANLAFSPTHLPPAPQLCHFPEKGGRLGVKSFTLWDHVHKNSHKSWGLCRALKAQTQKIKFCRTLH